MSEKPMQEGSRLWIEFAKDGTLIATGGIVASATCTFGDGELTLTVTEDGRSDALHMRVRFTPTEMTMMGADPAVPSAQNVTTHYKRTGGLTDPAAPQVGTWRASPGNEDGIHFASQRTAHAVCGCPMGNATPVAGQAGMTLTRSMALDHSHTGNVETCSR